MEYKNKYMVPNATFGVVCKCNLPIVTMYKFDDCMTWFNLVVSVASRRQSLLKSIQIYQSYNHMTTVIADLLQK